MKVELRRKQKTKWEDNLFTRFILKDRVRALGVDASELEGLMSLELVLLIPRLVP